MNNNFDGMLEPEQAFIMRKRLDYMDLFGYNQGWLMSIFVEWRRNFLAKNTVCHKAMKNC